MKQVDRSRYIIRHRKNKGTKLKQTRQMKIALVATTLLFMTQTSLASKRVKWGVITTFL